VMNTWSFPPTTFISPPSAICSAIRGRRAFILCCKGCFINFLRTWSYLWTFCLKSSTFRPICLLLFAAPMPWLSRRWAEIVFTTLPPLSGLPWLIIFWGLAVSASFSANWSNWLHPSPFPAASRATRGPGWLFWREDPSGGRCSPKRYLRRWWRCWVVLLTNLSSLLALL